MTNRSTVAIQRTIARLADPDVNIEIELASSVNVAKNIIQSLPGVRRLRRDGPQAAKAVLELLQDPQTLEDENLSAISLHILEAYPTKEVESALAKPISERRFTGINSVLAAETFLKAAGIQAARKDAPAIALREARKLYPTSTPKVTEKKLVSKSIPTVKRKKSITARRKRSLAAKK